MFNVRTAEAAATHGCNHHQGFNMAPSSASLGNPQGGIGLANKLGLSLGSTARCKGSVVKSSNPEPAECSPSGESPRPSVCCGTPGTSRSLCTASTARTALASWSCSSSCSATSPLRSALATCHLTHMSSLSMARLPASFVNYSRVCHLPDDSHVLGHGLCPRFRRSSSSPLLPLARQWICLLCHISCIPG